MTACRKVCSTDLYSWLVKKQALIYKRSSKVCRFFERSIGIHFYQYHFTQPILEATVKTMIMSNKDLFTKEVDRTSVQLSTILQTTYVVILSVVPEPSASSLGNLKHIQSHRTYWTRFWKWTRNVLSSPGDPNASWKTTDLQL